MVILSKVKFWAKRQSPNLNKSHFYAFVWESNSRLAELELTMGQQFDRRENKT
jgi:hypothetical protein